MIFRIYSTKASLSPALKAAANQPLTPADLSFSQAGEDLIVRSKTTADELIVQGQFAAGGAQGVDKIVFGNGITTWTRANLTANLVALPALSLTAGNDTYIGTAGADYVLALAGNDAILFGGNSGIGRIAHEYTDNNLNTASTPPGPRVWCELSETRRSSLPMNP